MIPTAQTVRKSGVKRAQNQPKTIKGQFRTNLDAAGSLMNRLPIEPGRPDSDLDQTQLNQTGFLLRLPDPHDRHPLHGRPPSRLHQPRPPPSAGTVAAVPSPRRRARSGHTDRRQEPWPTAMVFTGPPVELSSPATISPTGGHTGVRHLSSSVRYFPSHRQAAWPPASLLPTFTMAGGHGSKILRPPTAALHHTGAGTKSGGFLPSRHHQSITGGLGSTGRKEEGSVEVFIGRREEEEKGRRRRREEEKGRRRRREGKKKKKRRREGKKKKKRREEEEEEKTWDGLVSTVKNKKGSVGRRESCWNFDQRRRRGSQLIQRPSKSVNGPS